MVEKKIVENSTKGGEGRVSDGRFSTKKNNNMGLNHWILHNNQFKTHLFFFQILGGGTLFSSEKPSDKSQKTYRICFMARRSFFFSFLFFSPLTGGGGGGGGGQSLSGKFLSFFGNPSLNEEEKHFIWPSQWKYVFCHTRSNLASLQVDHEVAIKCTRNRYIGSATNPPTRRQHNFTSRDVARRLTT